MENTKIRAPNNKRNQAHENDSLSINTSVRRKSQGLKAKRRTAIHKGIFPDLNAAEALYRELHAPTRETIETPILNGWFGRMREHQRTVNLDDQLEE